jgi:hypothetical protein
MNGPAWRPQVQKLHIYEGIFNLNRAFHATLLSLERLENLGFFRAEYLNAYKIELEHTRANANDELIETLRDYEQDEGFRFWQMQKEWDDQLKDPDDVFFAAKNRKDEIKEQMKHLQSGLDRMKPKKKKVRSTRRKKTPRK